MPRISVVMPVYNTPAEYLREAMDSILTQTFADFEFIIVNDGSTDSQVERVIGSYDDSRIRYFVKSNTGIADTLNFGIAQATGEFVARMDSDDISLPDRFEKQVLFLDAHPEIGICGSWIETFPNKRILKHPARFGIWELALDGCIMAHPTVMFRRDEFARNGLHYNPEYDFAEDYELWVRASLVIGMGNVQGVLLRYRYNPNGVTSRRTREQREKTQRIRDRILDYIGFDKAAYRYGNRLDGVQRVTRIQVAGIPLVKLIRKDETTRCLLFHCLPIFVSKSKDL